MQEKVTIQDIARLAGVSKATVSRVLNHSAAVSAETSARVMQVVQEYGFVPNLTATGLAGGKTRMVGVLAPPLTWAGISDMLRGVAEYIEQTSYEMVLYSISFDRNHTDVIDRLLSLRMVAGLLAILPGELSGHLTERSHFGLPLVMIDDQVKPENVPWVGIDNIEGAYKATRYLLELGHRRIAFIQGPQHYICVVERFQGYKQALEEAGLAVDPALVYQGLFDIPSGRECAFELFASQPLPDAIFAGNDQMACGVLEVARERGVRVPEDVALIGFDDNPFSSHLTPSLTTIRQPFTEMGHRAIKQLLGMIDPDHRLAVLRENSVPEPFPEIKIDQNLHILLPTSLVVRDSTGTFRYSSTVSTTVPTPGE